MIRIDLDLPTPLEEQIRRGIREAVARGDVRPGDELPSSRQLARDLGIHFNTVARAYRSLRDDGLLAIGRGRGAIVRDRPAEPESVAVRDRVIGHLRDAITEARLGGLPWSRVEALLRSGLEQWRRGAK